MRRADRNLFVSWCTKRVSGFCGKVYLGNSTVTAKNIFLNNIYLDNTPSKLGYDLILGLDSMVV